MKTWNIATKSLTLEEASPKRYISANQQSMFHTRHGWPLAGFGSLSMKHGTIRHRKVYALAEALKIHRAEAVGILTALWELTTDQFPDGNIYGAPMTYLAEQCMYEGDGKILVEALIKCALVDKISDEIIYIHDWHEHCEDYVHKKLWRRKLRFANGLTPKIRAIDGADRAEAQRFYDGGTVVKRRRNSGVTALHQKVNTTADAMPCLAMPCHATPSLSSPEQKKIIIGPSSNNLSRRDTICSSQKHRALADGYGAIRDSRRDDTTQPDDDGVVKND